MEAERIVPGAAEQFATDTALAVVLAEQGGDRASKHPQVFGGLAAQELAPHGDVVEQVTHLDARPRRAVPRTRG